MTVLERGESQTCLSHSCCEAKARQQGLQPKEPAGFSNRTAVYTVLDGFFQNTFLLQDGDLQGEARAAFESARAELMALENGTREPTQTAWESARQTAEAWMKVMQSVAIAS